MIQFSSLPDAEADPWQQPLHEGSFQWVEGVDLVGSGDGGAIGIIPACWILDLEESVTETWSNCVPLYGPPIQAVSPQDRVWPEQKAVSHYTE